MDVIKEIKERLRKYPHATIESDDNSISVLPISKDGFIVSLVVGHDSYTVSFNGWHEDFKDYEEAIRCFAFGLSARCRLKESLRGGMACQWTVEYQEKGEWYADSSTGLLIFPFWMKKNTRYLQNNLINKGLGLSTF